MHGYFATLLSGAGDQNSSTLAPSEDMSCNHHYHNHTLLLYGEYGGIPENALINVCAWLVLLLLFAVLRKNAWNYGRIALVQKNERKWTQLFYGEVGSTSGSVLLNSEGSIESLDTPVQFDQGFCTWLTAVFKIKDEHILRKSGRDAVQYLTFQRYIITYLAIVCIISLVVVLPVNFQGNLEGTSTTFGHTTISNLEPLSPLLWIHVILALLFLPLGVYFMRHFSVNLKFEEVDTYVSRTLMITHIPKHMCNRAFLQQHFRESYPDCDIQDIQFAYNISKTMKMDYKREAAQEAKLWCETYLREMGNRPQMRRSICCCTLDGCGSSNCDKVDAIDFYSEEERKLMSEVELEKKYALQNPLGIAFIAFETEAMAYQIYKDHQTSCKCGNNPPISTQSRALEVYAWEVYNAPPPDDVYWENLSSNTDNWYIRATVVNFGLFMVLFFLTTPAVFVNSMGVLYFQNKLENVNPLLSEFVPTLMMWTIASLLPVIVSYSDQFLYHWTRSAENHSIMRKTFIFLLFMVIVLPSLGLTSAKAFVEWAVKSTNQTSYRWQCIFLPDNGAFFVNYVITSAFIGTALELIRFPELFMYTLRILCARSAAERAGVRKTILYEFPFGTQYAWMLLNVGMTIIYSLSCPLIAPCGLVYICFKHFVDRHNIYFAYGPSKINKRIHMTAINFVIVTIIMLQLVVLFFLFIRRGGTFDIKSSGDIVLVALIGFSLTSLLYIGQICFNIFKKISPISYNKFQADDENVFPCPPNAGSAVHVSFLPNVLKPSDTTDRSLYSIPGSAKKNYGTGNSPDTDEISQHTIECDIHEHES